MFDKLHIIKGIHPGIFLDHQLKKRKLAKGAFALSVGEYPQTFGEITMGKRRMKTDLALKVEKAMGWEEGFLMVLQAYYDIKMEKKKAPKRTPDLAKIRKVTFWDTTFDRIDWEEHKKGVINRIFERGNQEEKDEITRFYGEETVKELMDESSWWITHQKRRK